MEGGWGERWRGVGLVDPEAGCAGQREKGVAVGQGATYVASGLGENQPLFSNEKRERTVSVTAG